MNWYKKANTELYQKIVNIRSQLAQAAQNVYSEWTQDEDGMDPMLGTGGICQDIAEAMADVIQASAQCYAFSVDAMMGDQHVFVLACTETPDIDGQYEGYFVDIYPHHYETGGGFSWKKIPDVIFTPDMVTIYPADSDVIQSYINEDF